MFGLGSSLRAAREARGLELAEVEKQTKIRGRYLAALEEERFDELPAGYGRAFVRSYAQFLEFDPRHYLDEYASRFPLEEPQLPPPAPRRRRSLRLLVPLVLLGVVAGILAVAAAYFGSGKKAAPPPRPHPTHPRKPPLRPPVVQKAKAKPKSRPPVPPPPAPPPRVVVRAVGGDCWVLLRVGSASGRVVAERTLLDGQSVSAVAKPLLWIRLGAPSYAVVTVAGRRVALPQAGGPVDLLAGRRGAKISST